MPSPEPADYPPMTKVVSLTLSPVAKDAVIGMAVARAAAGAVGTGARRLESMGWDDRGVWVLLICATHFACWVGMALPFVLCDHFGLLQWYKLRRKPAQQAPNALWARLWADAALGQFVTAPLAAYAIYPAVRYFGAPKVADPLPASSWDLALGLVAAHVFNDFGFYATHRLLHEFPVLYRTIHKKVRVRANLAPPPLDEASGVPSPQKPPCPPPPWRPGTSTRRDLEPPWQRRLRTSSGLWSPGHS